MPELSAGLLMCRLKGSTQEYFLVHPGGPYYQNKNEGVWSIPKGLVNANEKMLECARREFAEETGLQPKGPFYALEHTRLKSGKTIYAWAFAGTWEENQGIVSNSFPLEWPPRSKKIIQVPEADKAVWADHNLASRLINPAQIVFLDRAARIPELFQSSDV